jgi:hypothetical protein
METIKFYYDNKDHYQELTENNAFLLRDMIAYGPNKALNGYPTFITPKGAYIILFDRLTMISENRVSFAEIHFVKNPFMKG